METILTLFFFCLSIFYAAWLWVWDSRLDTVKKELAEAREKIAALEKRGSMAADVAVKVA